MSKQPKAVCAVDQQPSNGLYLCWACWNALSAKLRAVPDLLDELDITISRQARIGKGRVGGRSAETPLVFNQEASDAKRHLGRTLARWWVRVSADHPITSYAAPAIWLAEHSGAVRRCPDAGQLYQDVTEAVRRVYAAIDHPEELWVCGTCDYCNSELWVSLAAVTTRCCGHTYEVLERRRRRLELVHDHLATASVISRVLPLLIGVQRSEKTVHTWFNNGRLARHGVDHVTNQPLYRVDEVVDLALSRPFKHRSAT